MADVTLSALDRLIPEIYDAALQPAQWPRVVADLARTLNAAGAELVNAGILLSQRWVLHNFPEDVVRAYVDRHAAADPVVPALMARARRQPVAFEFSQIATFMAPPLYEELVKPFGISRMMLACLGQEAGHGFELLALGRTARQRAFGAGELRAAARLVPHLRSAGIVQMRLDGAGEPFRAVLDGMAVPVAVLNRHGRLLFANLSAERLLGQRDGLHLETGRLSAAVPAVTAALQSAVDRAIASQLRMTQSPGEDLVLPRPSGKPPLAVHVAPLGRDNPYWSRGHRAAVGVFVEDPERAAPTSADRLRAVYGLTPAEARVALALAGGLSPAEISLRFGTAPKTVRTQLEAIFAKLGVRRQTQAVQRILALAHRFSSAAEA